MHDQDAWRFFCELYLLDSKNADGSEDEICVCCTQLLAQPEPLTHTEGGSHAHN